MPIDKYKNALKLRAFLWGYCRTLCAWRDIEGKARQGRVAPCKQDKIIFGRKAQLRHRHADEGVARLVQPAIFAHVGIHEALPPLLLRGPHQHPSKEKARLNRGDRGSARPDGKPTRFQS